MSENIILYHLLDFEINWNKYHLFNQKEFKIRLEQINTIFYKLGIIDTELINKQNANANSKFIYNAVKSGIYLNHISNKNLEGISYRLKSGIQNSYLIKKYPYVSDLDFNYTTIFANFFNLRCILYKLQNKFNSNDVHESLEFDIEKITYQNMLEKVEGEIKFLDLILTQFLNPYNKSLSDELFSQNFNPFNNSI